MQQSLIVVAANWNRIRINLAYRACSDTYAARTLTLKHYLAISSAHQSLTTPLNSAPALPILTKSTAQQDKSISSPSPALCCYDVDEFVHTTPINHIKAWSPSFVLTYAIVCQTHTPSIARTLHIPQSPSLSFSEQSPSLSYNSNAGHSL